MQNVTEKKPDAEGKHQNVEIGVRKQVSHGVKT